MKTLLKPIIYLLAMTLTVACKHDDTEQQIQSPSGASDQQTAIQSQPNIILINLDDSGYGDYSHNGNPTINTPNISKMAHEGANFTQFYVTSPACSVSRYSLLTGRYPARSGFPNWVIGPHAERYLHPKEITLAEGLLANGYTTGMFGKWHTGTPNQANDFTPESLPLAHGFQEWIGTNVSHDYADAMLLQSNPQGNTPAEGYERLADKLRTNTDAAQSLTRLYTDAALTFIEKNKDQPFFAYIAYNQPHLGLFCAENFEGVSRRGKFGDVMAEIDASIGEILTQLNTYGISKNTLIIFTSDNGPWVRFEDTENHPFYGEARMNIGYAMPFRDGKGSTWEGGHRVPCIFYWPDTIKPYTRIEAPASTLDILPTLFALTGTELPQDRSIDGRDIRPYLSEDLLANTEVKPFALMYSANQNQTLAYRQGPWKIHVGLTSQLGRTYGFQASRETPLLFQVEQDLSERFNRAEKYPETVANMLENLEAIEANIAEEGTFWDP